MIRSHDLRLRASLLGLVLILMAASPCDKPPSNVKPELPKTDPKQAEAVVQLPDPPKDDAFVIKEKHDDGVLRIAGIAEYKDRHLDKVVTLRGKVVTISEVCDPAKAKKKGKSCREPHLIIEDSDRATRRMFVVGFPMEFPKIAKLTAGEVYDFKGTYKMTSQGFAATETGLLLLDEVNEKNVVEIQEMLNKKKRKR